MKLIPEWSESAAILLVWPHENSDWVEDLIAVEQVYLALVGHLQTVTQVIIFCGNEPLQNRLQQQFNALNFSNLTLLHQPSNDTWIRDYGPITAATDDHFVFNKFIFNGWGGKFAAPLDNQLFVESAKKSPFAGTPLIQQQLILEGGSIDYDGDGCLLTTEHCLLNKNRNPHFSKQDYQQFFKTNFTIEKVHWLNSGMLIGDDTDSHVDMLARFCPNKKIVYCQSVDASDPHHSHLVAMEQQLKTLTDSNEDPYQLIPIPLPEPIYHAKERLPASYLNFLICNGIVLVPIYEQARDELAIMQLQKAFPQHRLIPVYSTPLIRQHGAIHCISMQIPQGALT